LLKRELPDEVSTMALGRELAPLLMPGMVVWLDGDLGAGKTTLVRAMLRTLGYAGTVKSPTYTLVELYVVSRIYWYHFDFYRFSNPEEFLDAGLDEYFCNDAVCLVEWPNKAAGFVPPADLVLRLQFLGNDSLSGRAVDLLAYSERGCQCLNILANHNSQDVA
jgi:tRNA threonylcarbamoyladenosine biosynthesis protein TsaE